MDFMAFLYGVQIASGVLCFVASTVAYYRTISGFSLFGVFFGVFVTVTGVVGLSAVLS